MMWGWDMGGWWLWSGITTVLLLVAAIFVTAIVLLLRSNRPGPPESTADESAYRLLEERLARGEIATDEFRERLAALDEAAARRRAAL